MPELLHLTHTGPWNEAQGSGVYAIPPGDPFIHCCSRAQLPGVVERFFPGSHGDVIVLTVDPDGLRVVVEAAADGFGDFPHIYEPLPIDNVTDVRPLAVVLAEEEDKDEDEED
ncbi:MAG: glutathione S-transferase [Solirubrobacterales bacterium]|nr:glutathione S-transferase [Solirubrobacterales bacterium]